MFLLFSSYELIDVNLKLSLQICSFLFLFIIPTVSATQRWLLCYSVVYIFIYIYNCHIFISLFFILLYKICILFCYSTFVSVLALSKILLSSPSLILPLFTHSLVGSILTSRKIFSEFLYIA